MAANATIQLRWKKITQPLGGPSAAVEQKMLNPMRFEHVTWLSVKNVLLCCTPARQLRQRGMCCSCVNAPSSTADPTKRFLTRQK